MPLLSKVAAAPGAVLAMAAGLTGVIRGDKPLHPQGTLGTGTMHVDTPAPALGVPLFATPGVQPVSLRLSRAMGLPDPLVDIEGLALRIPGAGADGGVADVLFASTGTGQLSRFMLTLRPPGRHGSQTTLLPVRSMAGPLLLRLAPLDPIALPTKWQISWAIGRSGWTEVATLDVAWAEGDTTERFDPVTNLLDGVTQYPVVSALREPSYVSARALAHPEPNDPIKE